MNFFNIILYKPLFNALILLYNFVPGQDFGVAIIFLTLIIKSLLAPLAVKSVKSQKELQDIQPKIKEIQNKYKNDKERQAKELLEVYKTQKINPFGGVLLTFIQLPILIALYYVFRNGLNSGELVNLYSFVPSPMDIHTFFLGIVDLSKPNLWIAIIAGVSQYFQTKTLMPKQQTSGGSKQEDFTKILQFQATYFLPIFTIIILLSLPSALGLYWIVGGLFSAAQQHFILKKVKNN